MTLYRFEEIRRAAHKRVKCAGCGKLLKRQHTFTQTLNPFNKNANGTIKDRLDIWRELVAECEAWETSDNEYRCTMCQAWKEVT